MRAVIQRVSRAEVVVEERSVGSIGTGVLALVAIQPDDNTATADKMLHKLLNYRLFSDEDGRMNRSLREVSGGLLLVSQFTLAADTTKGMRPSFTSAAAPAMARELFDYLVAAARAAHSHVATGCFGADMQVSLVNDGPVTFLLEVK